MGNGAVVNNMTRLMWGGGHSTKNFVPTSEIEIIIGNVIGILGLIFGVIAILAIIKYTFFSQEARDRDY
jgi:hypothetical protein